MFYRTGQKEPTNAEQSTQGTRVTRGTTERAGGGQYEYK